MSRDDGIIGVSDHGGWAVLVTVAGDGTLLDRRRVELVDEDLPKIPHHSEGQALPLHEAVALVERVRVSAERHAKLGLKCSLERCGCACASTRAKNSCATSSFSSRSRFLENTAWFQTGSSISSPVNHRNNRL